MNEGNTGNQPEKKFSTGVISATVWKNNGTSKKIKAVLQTALKAGKDKYAIVFITGENGQNGQSLCLQSDINRFSTTFLRVNSYQTTCQDLIRRY